MAAKDQTATKKLATEKFTWRIESFSKQKQARLSSNTFSAGGRRWSIIVYPKGDWRHGALSAYLELADAKNMEEGSSLHVYYSVTVVDQINPSSSVKREREDFTKENDASGWRQFIEMVELHDPGKGYLVNDTLIIEAEVTVEAPASEVAAANDDHEPKVMEAIQVSLINPLPQHNNEVVTPASYQQNGPASSPFSPSNVESASRNLIAQLSSMTIRTSNANSSSNPDQGSDLLRQQKEKLIGFLGMPLEAICQTNSLDEVDNIAIKIVEHATDPIEKVVLKDLLSRLAKFKEIVPNSLSAIETSNGVESSVAQMTKHMEARLVHRKRQMSSLQDEVSRLGEEDRNLEAEMQQLAALRAKIVDHRKSTEVELEKASQEACKDMEELKKQYGESEQVIKTRMRAKDKLARANASWKLFKENLGW